MLDGTLTIMLGLASAAGCSLEDRANELVWDEVSQEVGTLGGFVVVSGDDADDSGHCQGTRCGGAYPRFLKEAITHSRSGGSGILAIGANAGSARSSFTDWNRTSNGGPGAAVDHIGSTSDILNVDFNQYAVIYLPSYERHTPGGLTDAQLDALATRQPDIAEFVNDRGGSLIALTQADARSEWSFLPNPLTTQNADFEAAKPTAELVAIAPNVTRANLSHCCFHNVFTGPVGSDGLYQGLKVLAVHDEAGLPGFGKPVILGGRDVVLTAEDCSDNLDNDGDGLIDKEDPDCYHCGDGILDPDEECDDANTDDGDGCSSACEIEDLPPVAVCQDASRCNAAGQCYAAITGLGAGSYDPEGAPLSIIQSPAGPYTVGQHQVSITVSDGQSQDQCIADVQVNDCEAPDVDCAPDFRVECTGNGAATVTPPDASATDNCGAPPVDGPPAGPMPLGTHALSYAASDDAGNTAVCTTSVTVEDTTPPSIACPAPSVTECAGNGQATVDPGQAQTSDTCTSATVDTPGTGSYPLGTTSVAYTAVDQAGNQASCTTAVTVQDTNTPSITCPTPSVAECTGNGQAAVNPGQAQASDSCTEPTVNVPGTSNYPLGTTGVQYTAVDQSGNQTSCTTAVTVQDTMPPAIACPAPSVAECTGNGQATVDPGAAQVADICTSATANIPGANSYPLGSTDVAYTAADLAGNQASCTTAVTVQDTTAPTISCPAPIVVECTGDSSADVIPGEALASDICTEVAVNGPPAGSYPLGTTEVTYAATDLSGNQASCTSTIQVVDTTPGEVKVHPPQPLWPPNHKYVTLDLIEDCGVMLRDLCGGMLDPVISAPTITCVTSDEPENSHSDGSTVQDIVIVDATTVKLRAERQGMGDGRVYNVHFQVQDGSGNVSEGVCPIKVPHDQRRGIHIVDSGVEYQVCR